MTPAGALLRPCWCGGPSHAARGEARQAQKGTRSPSGHCAAPRRARLTQSTAENPSHPRPQRERGWPGAHAVLIWLAWRSTKAHATVLVCPACHGRSCRSARRRAVVPWLLTWRHGRSTEARRRAAVLWLLTWRHAEAHAAVLLCPRAADTPPCCCALAGVARGGPPGAGVTQRRTQERGNESPLNLRPPRGPRAC